MNVDDLLRRHESLRLIAYVRKGDVPTIAYGHTRGVAIGLTCILQQAEEWLVEDKQDAIEDVCALLSPKAWNACNEARQAALIDMAFNLGRERMSGFRRMLEAIEVQNWTVARDEMRASEWHGEVGVRAEDDEHLIFTGDWPLAA